MDFKNFLVFGALSPTTAIKWQTMMGTGAVI